MERLGNPDFKQLTVDFNQLQHMMAFQAGYLQFQQRYVQQPGKVYGVKNVVQTMSNHCSFLPFKLPNDKFRVNAFHGFKGEEFKQEKGPENQVNSDKGIEIQEYPTTASECSSPASERQEPHSSGPDLSNIQTLKSIVEEDSQPIKVDKALYNKPVAVIYNPTSGKKKDIRQLIYERLTIQQIDVQFFETLRGMHAWDLAEKEIDFSEFSALIAVGGDGTLHEVINGMMMREDGKKLPVALVPNGSGNDLVGSLGCKDLDMAIDWIIKGDVIKMDLNKMLIDADCRDDIPQGKLSQQYRYSATSASLGFIAKVVHNAISHKPYFGGASYLTSGATGFLQNYTDMYDISIYQQDGQITKLSNIQSMMVMVMNGNYAGGRMPFAPGAYLNDGLLDFVLQRGGTRIKDGLNLLKNMIALDGQHIYTDQIAYFRAKKIMFTNKNYDQKGGANPQKVPQMFQVDGEAFLFQDRVTMEVVPEAIDLIVDYQQLMTQSQLLGTFKPRI